MILGSAQLSCAGVNAADLFLLSRRLMQIAESALPSGGKGATSLRFVVIDIANHPGSSISEITERTGFPQSLVSMTVAKLRDLHVVETEPDPADRRRTLVSPAAGMAQRAEHGPGGVSVDDAVAGALDPEDRGELPEVHAALELLARLLLRDSAAADAAAF
jgi:DNA-binding transcriptional ArsR family regulator